MKTFIVTSPETPVPTLVQSIGLRMGYLLSEKIGIAGATASFVSLHKMKRPEKISEAVNMLLSIKEMLSVNETEIVQQYLQLQKIFNKTKNKAPEFIKLYKNLEHKLWKMYDVVMEDTFYKLERPEMTGLRPLISESFWASPFNIHNTEEDSDSYIPMSSVICPAEKEDVLYNPILLIDFMLANDVKQYKQYRAENGLARGLQDIIPQPLLTFPNLNQLNADELRILRDTLQPAATEWRKTIDQWLMLVEGGHLWRAIWMRKKIIAASGLMQKAIDDAPLIRRLKQTSKIEDVVQFCAGSMYYKELWQCYRYDKTMRPETWQVLQQQLAKRPDLNKRWVSFFFVHVIGVNLTVPKEDGGKKYLDI
ncbi:MAG: hypothetical protein ACKVOR_13350 [Flavobacteriales bacterium]